MLTIRDHIIAGHYPTNDRGFALVPIEYGTAIIATPYGPPNAPLVGWYGILGSEPSIHGWTETGRFNPQARPGCLDLRPPVVRIATPADLGLEAA